MPGFLAHSERVVEPERNAKVFAPVAPRRVVSHAEMVGISYPVVHYREAARFWNCEAFNVNPLPYYGCMERVRIAGLRLTGPPSFRKRPDGIRMSVPRNELRRERRAHNRPVLDLRLADRT